MPHVSNGKNAVIGPRIGTHNGTFHADEVLACAMLKQLPEFANHEIVRTRDSTELATCDIVIDVGGVFDPDTHRYDHHQRYNINSGLSSRVAMLNPQWNQKDADEMVCFNRAFDMVGEEFVALVRHYADTWYPARDVVACAMKRRFEVDASGHILSLEGEHCPWPSHLHDLEEQELENRAEICEIFNAKNPKTTTGRPIFCMYRRENGHWSVQAIGISKATKFLNRISMPEQWCGLRDAELCKAVGIPGCVFVHATGFLGIHETRDGALRMARSSLQMANLPCGEKV